MLLLVGAVVDVDTDGGGDFNDFLEWLPMDMEEEEDIFDFTAILVSFIILSLALALYYDGSF